MARIITDYLEETTKRYKDKIAFVDPQKSISFVELRMNALSIATKIIHEGLNKAPVGIFLDKGVTCVTAILGVAYSGNYYSVIDTDMPFARISKIMNILEPAILITDYQHLKDVEKIANGCVVLLFEDLLNEPVNETTVKNTTDNIIDSDVLYVLFTSGSTGTPKGVVTSHRSVISYMEAVTDAYGLNENTIIGNQAPLYFVLSLLDVFSTIKNGGTTHFIDKSFFTFPGNLVKYISANNINFLNWVCSALCLVANMKALKKVDLSCVKTVIFGGEMMPIKQLNAWIKALPETTFVNAYGCTEVTDSATYYIVDRAFSDSDLLPLGKPFNNTGFLLLDTNGCEVRKGEIGELYCRGNNITYGYLKDPDRTNDVFIQNPLNSAFREIVYKTGDLARINDRGEVEYIGRRDSQIKHMGHRIELGEIEATANSMSGVLEICCLYDDIKKQILLIYSGTADVNSIENDLPKLLPTYMIPNKVIKLEKLPYNLNGKIDRKKLKEIINR